MASVLPKVSIRKGREWQTQRGHPWLFSGAISQAPKAAPGSIVELIDVNGKFVGRGYFNPNCDIAVRVLTLNDSEQIDQQFFESRIRNAWRLRKMSIAPSTNAFRLINAEGDFLPGFIVDFFAGTLVVQSHTAGADALLQPFLEALKKVTSPDAIVLRNDVAARKREGLEIEEPKIVFGELPKHLIVLENGLKFGVDPIHGQKTGFFADQRDKRQALGEYCKQLAPPAVLANCFCYTAGFSVYAALGNHDLLTINVDESGKALDQAKHNFELNGISPEAHKFVQADAFAWLEEQQQDGALFDVLILDPPAFAKSTKDKAKALKGYYRMTRSGIVLVKQGGLMVVCSCSGRVSMEEFMSAVREGVADSGRSAQFIEQFQHGCDHPVNAAAPEGFYLKVLFCKIT